MALPISYNIRSLVVRWKTTLLAILGIALVVTVFVALVGLSDGFRLALGSTGSKENAIVVQKGSATELTSVIPKDQQDVVLVDDRIRRDSAGAPLSSAEMVVVANLKHRKDDSPTNVTVRGVTPSAFEVRVGIRVTRGRRFSPGLYEIIVGRRISERIKDLDLDGTIRIQKKDWKVVGIFEADGSGFESEIWMDSKVLSQAFNRREVAQSLTLRMKDPEQITALGADLARDPKLQLEVKEERTYYDEQAGGIATSILALAGFVSVVMGIGAVFGGMNTMYAIVAARTREIATLRTLGFSRGSILAGILFESVFLALIGALIGCAFALPVNTMTAATGGPGFAEIAFAFHVTPLHCAIGTAFALVMGVMGGLLPALRAAGLPIASALKES